MRFFVFCTLVGVALGGAVELSADNFDSVVLNSGKNAFIKFLAPWWGHCKAMKPAWDKLGAEYKDSSSVVIADADCTVHQDLCQKYDVKGYPTIKYYKDGTFHDYSGGRDFDGLKSFTKDNLEVQCDVNEQSGCTDKEKKFIAKVKPKGADYFMKQKTRLEGMAKKSMRASLKQWVMARLNIFKQLVAESSADKGKEEL